METLFVTSDFSGNSKAGIRFAIQLSRQAGYELIFYHVIEIMKPTSWNDAKYKKFAAEKIAEHTAKLHEFVSGIALEMGVVMGNHKFIAEIGTDVDAMIIAAAKKARASFICMSTHGAGKIRKLFGTNASELVTTSTVPVIVVPKRYIVKPIEKIFYASDMSAPAKELKKVQELAAPLKASITVYHYDYLLHVPENRAVLEKKVRPLLSAGVSFHFKRQEIEYSLGHHLKKDIKKEQASMVVLFTKQNRGWFDRLFEKTETAELSFSSPVPIVAFRKK